MLSNRPADPLPSAHESSSHGVDLSHTGRSDIPTVSFGVGSSNNDEGKLRPFISGAIAHDPVTNPHPSMKDEILKEMVHKRRKKQRFEIWFCASVEFECLTRAVLYGSFLFLG